MGVCSVAGAAIAGKPAPTGKFFIIRGAGSGTMKVSGKYTFFPVYERAMPAIGLVRCLRRMRVPPPPIAGMARSYTNIGAISSSGAASDAMKVSVKNRKFPGFL